MLYNGYPNTGISLRHWVRLEQSDQVPLWVAEQAEFTIIWDIRLWHNDRASRFLHIYQRSGDIIRFNIYSDGSSGGLIAYRIKPPPTPSPALNVV